MNQILIIEDEENQILLYKHQLKNEIGIEITYVNNYLEALATISSRTFDLYIIDLNLKGHSGLDIIDKLQSEASIENRIIVASANQNDDLAIQCYNLGVSNIISKPINFHILRAIIRKNLKAIQHIEKGVIRFNNIELDSSSHSCIIKKENAELQKIELTPIEFKILYHLARRLNVIVSKDELSTLGKDLNNPISDKSIEMHVSSIRKKFNNEKIILSKRGLGYLVEN